MADRYHIPGQRSGTGARDTGAYKRRNRKPSRQAGTKTGVGYSTNRTDSRYKFEIRIEHGRFDVSMNQARQQMQKYMGIIENEFLNTTKQIPTFKTGYMMAYGAARKGTAMKTMTSAIQTQLNSEKFIKAIYDDFASDVGRLGVSNVRSGIKEPEKRPLSFRYDTGTMYNSVTFDKRQNKDDIVISVGWVDTFYKYFDFQERGTKSIGAMNSITRGYRQTAPQAYRLLFRFMSNYTNKDGFSGRYTR